MIETWKDIPGYSGKYQADREGNIRRVYKSKKTRLMTPYHKKMSGSQRMVVKLSKDGKTKEEILCQVIARTFLGPPPKGCVAYHRNQCQSDNYVNNIAYISREKLGKMTGRRSRSCAVVKISAAGEIVDVYSSAREAARQNYMSRQTVTDRCNGKCKSVFAPDGYAYAWEDKGKSLEKTMRRVELSEEYMPKAKTKEFEW